MDHPSAYFNDAIVVHCADGKVERVNKHAERLLGYTTNELKHNGILKKLFDEMHAAAQSPLRDLSGDKNSLVFETRLQHKNGTTIDVEVSSRIADTKTGLVQSLIRDVTQKKRVEQEILKAQKFESLGRFASGLAHDFNNILTAITGSITLAKMYTKKGEKVFDKLIQAERATQRASELTRQLSLFSKGGLPAKKPTSIAQFLKYPVGLSLRGSNVRYECSNAEGLWPVHIDAGQIREVLNNLIINADQAMEEGGTIIISAANYVIGPEDTIPLEPGNYVKVTVQDEGCSIPAEDRARVFEPYFTTRRNGNGLSLATTYSIVKKHNGYIHAESPEDAGAVFSIYLPCAQENAIGNIPVI